MIVNRNVSLFTTRNSSNGFIIIITNSYSIHILQNLNTNLYEMTENNNKYRIKNIFILAYMYTSKILF